MMCVHVIQLREKKHASNFEFSVMHTYKFYIYNNTQLITKKKACNEHKVRRWLTESWSLAGLASPHFWPETVGPSRASFFGCATWILSWRSELKSPFLGPMLLLCDTSALLKSHLSSLGNLLPGHQCAMCLLLVPTGLLCLHPPPGQGHG